MDSERARELLAAERRRIERALAWLEHQDTGEEAEDPADLGADLCQDEFDEGRADDLREELATVERAEERPLPAGTYGISIVAEGRRLPGPGRGGAPMSLTPRDGD
jgi:RNA polymerase-binding transcription factor DksA